MPLWLQVTRVGEVGGVLPNQAICGSGDHGDGHAIIRSPGWRSLTGIAGETNAG